MTFVSLLVNLLTMALINWRNKIPPPHSVMLVASAINSMLCCLKPGNLTSAEVAGDGSVADGDNSSSKVVTEWDQIWVLLNNALSVLVIVIYIIGVIIITA